MTHKGIKQWRYKNFTCSKWNWAVVVVFLNVFFFALNQEWDGTYCSQFSYNDNAFVHRLDRLVHENSICIQTVLAHWITSILIWLTKDNDCFCFTNLGSLKIIKIQSWTSYKINVLKSIDLTPDICVTIDIFITEVIITQDNNWSFYSSLESWSQRKNEILDTFNDSTNNDVSIDVLIKLLIVEVSILFQTFWLRSCIKVLIFDVVWCLVFVIIKFDKVLMNLLNFFFV